MTTGGSNYIKRADLLSKLRQYVGMNKSPLRERFDFMASTRLMRVSDAETILKMRNRFNAHAEVVAYIERAEKDRDIRSGSPALAGGPAPQAPGAKPTSSQVQADPVQADPVQGLKDAAAAWSDGFEAGKANAALAQALAHPELRKAVEADAKRVRKAELQGERGDDAHRRAEPDTMAQLQAGEAAQGAHHRAEVGRLRASYEAILSNERAARQRDLEEHAELVARLSKKQPPRPYTEAEVKAAMDDAVRAYKANAEQSRTHELNELKKAVEDARLAGYEKSRAELDAMSERLGQKMDELQSEFEAGVKEGHAQSHWAALPPFTTKQWRKLVKILKKGKKSRKA